MKSLIKLTTILTLLSLFVACECDKDVKCEGLSSRSESLLTKELEAKHFTNGSDSTISINFDDKFVRQESTKECLQGLKGGCDCMVCPTVLGTITYALNPPIGVHDSILVVYEKGTYRGGKYHDKDTSFYNYYYGEYDFYRLEAFEFNMENKTTLKFRFLDVGAEIPLLLEAFDVSINTDKLTGRQKLIESYSTPVANFKNVIEITYENQVSYFFTKVYYHINHGVIAFESIDNDYFYLSS